MTINNIFEQINDHFGGADKMINIATGTEKEKGLRCLNNN
jgi:hypothetical protein